MSRFKRIALALFATLALILGISGCSSVSTAPDQVALHYEGGSFSSKKFKNCVDPSTKDWNGPGDMHYTYPASQRNFVFSKSGDADGPVIEFVTRDGIEMKVEGVTNFLLDTRCETLREFHELIGNRYAAYMDGDTSSEGWLRMLNVYIYRPLDTAIDRAAQGYTYQELYLDPSKKAAWEKDVVDALPALVDRQTDGEEDFFKNFAVTLQKPEPPASIKQALVDQQAQVAKANAAKAKADAEVAQAQAETQVAQERAKQREAEIAGYGNIDAYLKAKAIERGINPYQPSYGAAVVSPK